MYKGVVYSSIGLCTLLCYNSDFKLDDIFRISFLIHRLFHNICFNASLLGIAIAQYIQHIPTDEHLGYVIQFLIVKNTLMKILLHVIPLFIISLG